MKKQRRKAKKSRRRRRRRPSTPTSHRTKHHAHETTDAYAEGWDSHERAAAGAVPRNPYRWRLARIVATRAKRSPRQIETMERDADLWDEGWRDFAEQTEDGQAQG